MKLIPISEPVQSYSIMRNDTNTNKRGNQMNIDIKAIKTLEAVAGKLAGISEGLLADVQPGHVNYISKKNAGEIVKEQVAKLDLLIINL